MHAPNTPPKQRLFVPHRTALTAALAFAASVAPAFADDGLDVSGSVRARYEALNGQPRAGFAARDELLALRTIVAAEYRSGDFTAELEIDDSRAYFAKRTGSVGAKNVNVLEPVQAYLGYRFRGALGEGSQLDLKAGRFLLNLGTRRLVSSSEDTNATNAYSGLMATATTHGGLDATLFYTLPLIQKPNDLASILDNDFAFDRQSLDLRFWAAYLAQPVEPLGVSIEAGFYRLDERDAPRMATRNRHISTASARLYRKPVIGAADFEVEGAWQTGRIRRSILPAATELDVGALMVHAAAGYSFHGRAKLRLSLGYDYVSGDRGGRRYNRFDTLFGSRRGDFAPSGIYTAIGRANISSPVLRAEVAPGKRFDATASYRPMWLASRTDAFSTTGVRDASGRSGSFAGHQFEARVRYWLIPGALRGELNAVGLAKARFLKNAPNAPAAGDTHYLSTALTASF